MTNNYNNNNQLPLVTNFSTTNLPLQNEGNNHPIISRPPQGSRKSFAAAGILPIRLSPSRTINNIEITVVQDELIDFEVQVMVEEVVSLGGDVGENGIACAKARFSFLFFFFSFLFFSFFFLFFSSFSPISLLFQNHLFFLSSKSKNAVYTIQTTASPSEPGLRESFRSILEEVERIGATQVAIPILSSSGVSKEKIGIYIFLSLPLLPLLLHSSLSHTPYFLIK